MFPNLHELSLGWNAGMKEMWYDHAQQLVSQCFPNLEVVTLVDYPQHITVLPSYLLPLSSFPNLQTLGIRNCYFEDMLFQSDEEKFTWQLFSQITELRLHYLPKLRCLWKEKEGFRYLRILDVFGCPNLKINLVSSSVSFRNLMDLKVERCDGIFGLISHSTAKSLVQLKEMSVSRCKGIKEIIQGGDDDDDDDDEISFPRLYSLKLVSLPNLQSFCSSGNHTFQFSSLQTLVVKDCLMMEMFSQGQSNTPMLHNVTVSEWTNECHWEGNLNSTIQQLFRR
ncbi:hypothetical protein V6N13_090736 [Hibiscus sabdariffa]|uniref:Disease resistance protein At4g27190-like leucine-rich repeats domain-containing protein n=1 Tax=Hibiscus sabdariffa TaxID=183260 RepID=A0ABR2BP56_9ROSI